MECIAKSLGGNAFSEAFRSKSVESFLHELVLPPVRLVVFHCLLDLGEFYTPIGRLALSGCIDLRLRFRQRRAAAWARYVSCDHVGRVFKLLSLMPRRR